MFYSLNYYYNFCNFELLLKIIFLTKYIMLLKLNLNIKYVEKIEKFYNMKITNRKILQHENNKYNMTMCHIVKLSCCYHVVIHVVFCHVVLFFMLYKSQHIS